MAGGAGVAAPVLGPDGLAIASIGVSAPQQRLSAESLRVLAGSVRQAASALSALLRLHTHRVPPAI
jgi:DNA-binding IclR family transcriptional regulator